MSNELTRVESAVGPRYRVERVVGRGGMSTVYLAHDARHQRAVALKVLHPELAAALGSERFLREIRITARLEHPNILPLLDSGAAAGLLYYVMPYIGGESLRDRLSRERQLPVGEALRIAVDIADALEYAHSLGIVHRDVKPANILLSNGHARLADFGIATAASEVSDAALTASGIVMGTVAYMSPEQAGGARSIDARSDQYSLACVLYEMLVGEPPFTGPTPQAILARKSTAPVPSISMVRSSVPASVEHAVTVALATAPADRFASTAAFARALSTPTIHRGRRSLSRYGRRAGAAAMALALMIAGVTAVWNARSAAANGDVSSRHVAVFPFSVEDPELEYLREGIMDLLSHAIDGAGEVRRVDPNVLLGHVPTGRAVDLALARKIARRVGAGKFVLGRVVPSGRSVQIIATLYTEADNAPGDQELFAEGSVDSLSSIIDAVATDLLLHLPSEGGTWVTEGSLPSRGGSSVIREYSRGEGLMRRYQADSAALAFRVAVAEDSTFALGWLRLAFAESFRGDDEKAQKAIDLAVAHIDHLGSRDRLLARAVHRMNHGDFEGSERAAQLLVGEFPEYAEGWYRLGQAKLWSAWRRGRSPLEAEAAFERAHAIDSGHPQVLNSLGWMAALDGRRARVSSLMVRAQGSRFLPVPSEADASTRLGDRPTPFIVSTVRRAAWNTEDRLVDALAVARLLTEGAHRSEEDRWIGYLLQGRLQAARGRWRDAENNFRMGDAIGPGLGLLEAAYLAAVPLTRVAADRRRTLRDSLRDWAPLPTYSPSLGRTRPMRGSLLMQAWLVPHARIYALGLLSAGLGDVAAAQRYADQLRRSDAPDDSIGLLDDLSLEVRALLAMQARDTAGALAILDGVGFRLTSAYQVAASPFHMRPVARLLRAACLETLGRPREALGWYAGFANRFDTPEWVFLAGTNLRQGELHERLGQPERAAFHYRRFVSRWNDGEIEHQALVSEVRTRLARLEARK